MRCHVVTAQTDALAYHDRTAKCCYTGVYVHNRAACKVDGTHVEDQAIRVPNHVGDGEVNDGDPQ